MGTGVVSIALSLDGLETLSRVLLGTAAVAWTALGLALAGRVVQHRDRLLREATAPAALTSVAATAVLGARVTTLGWAWVSAMLLAIAFVLWCGLLTPVLTHWATPTAGVSLMLAVSTESLTVLSATIAEGEHERWLLDAALVPFLVGLGFYGLVMARFDRGELMRGRGDHWVTGGALAIAALAAGHITLAATSLRALEGVHAELKLISLVLWLMAVAWAPILFAGELLRPRLSYDVRRWSTVFPIGMYAACSFVVGKSVAAPTMTQVARVCTWAGVVVWLLVTVAAVLSGLKVLRREAIGG